VEIIAYMFGTMGFVFGLSALGKVNTLDEDLEAPGVIPQDSDKGSDKAE
jgi:hypothetical protein